MRRSVLITRPREDAGRTADLVASRGFVPLVAPLLNVRHLSPALPGAVRAVLVTSGNALAGLPVLPVPLLAVGDVTAARARAAGFADVHSAGRDAAALVELARQIVPPDAGPVLLACGMRQGFALAASLRAAGYRVFRRVTYDAAPVRTLPAAAADALRGDALYAVLFLSAETAATFVRVMPSGLCPRLANVLALAIGKPAADALDALPWREIRLARTPTLDDVLAQL